MGTVVNVAGTSGFQGQKLRSRRSVRNARPRIGIGRARTTKGGPMAKRAKSSEVHAYAFINDELHERGWVVRNPSRNANGQVWTQNECLADDEIKARLGLDRPESIIKVSEKILWIIEAKPEHKQLAQAIDEAVEYATHIRGRSIRLPLYLALPATQMTPTWFRLICCLAERPDQ